jgi:hypothetical protein
LQTCKPNCKPQKPVKVLDFIMVELTMSRLIYDMYYAGEITLEQCMRLIDKWNDTKNRTRYR